MARKRYNEEDILRLLREIDVHLHGGMDVMSAHALRVFLTRPIMDGVSVMAAWGVRSTTVVLQEKWITLKDRIWNNASANKK